VARPARQAGLTPLVLALVLAAATPLPAAGAAPSSPWTLEAWLARTDDESLDWICYRHRGGCDPTAPEGRYRDGEAVWWAQGGG
jgi:hypothetical protein